MAIYLKLTAKEEKKMLLPKNVLLELYRKMLLDRYLEEAMVEIYRQDY